MFIVQCFAGRGALLKYIKWIGMFHFGILNSIVNKVQISLLRI